MDTRQLFIGKALVQHVETVTGMALDTRSAPATTLGPSGAERTYLFCKACSAADGCKAEEGDVAPVMYVWREEVPSVDSLILSAADAFANGWTGPCQLRVRTEVGSENVMPAHSPAAAGNDDSLFVAWNESANAPGEPLRGTVRALALEEMRAGCTSS